MPVRVPRFRRELRPRLLQRAPNTHAGPFNLERLRHPRITSRHDQPPCATCSPSQRMPPPPAPRVVPRVRLTLEQLEQLAAGPHAENPSCSRVPALAPNAQPTRSRHRRPTRHQTLEEVQALVLERRARLFPPLLI